MRLVLQKGFWSLTSSVLVDPGSACEAGQPQDLCRLPLACGSLDRLTASTILTAKVAIVREEDVIYPCIFLHYILVSSLQGRTTSIKYSAKCTQISTQLSVFRARRSRPFCSLSPTPPLTNSSTSLRVCSSSSSLTMGSRAARYRSHVCFKGGTGSLGKPSWCTRDLSGICVTGLTRWHGLTMPDRS